MVEMKMIQQNGVGGTNELCLRSAASPVCDQVKGVEHQKAPEGERDGEFEDSYCQGESGTSMAETVAAPDGGWGWVVLVATIMLMALTLAFPACVGIFYTDLQNDFDATNSQTSWVPSIMISALHAGGPLCSVLVERIGGRKTIMLGGVLSGLGMTVSSLTQSISQLFLTAGVITGLGFCFSFQPAVTILGHYFVRRRAFANAMSSMGTALGLCILPILGEYLHTELGWRGSFLVLGGLLLNCCVCGAVMRPLQLSKRQRQTLVNHSPHLPEDDNRQRETGRWKRIWHFLLDSLGKHMAFGQFCNNAHYRVYAIGLAWMMLGFLVPLIFLVPYATAHGMEQAQAALVLSILGVINVIVRPGFGIIFNMPWFKGRHVYVFASALLVNGLSNCICCIGSDFTVLVIYVIVFGLSMSVVGSLMYTVFMDVVEMSHFQSALGLVAVMESVTLLIGPPLAGALVDKTGQYYHVFYVCAVVVASAAIFIFVSFRLLDRKSTQRAPGLGESQGRTEADVAPGCMYKSVPTDGDKEKVSPPAAEYSISI